MTENGLQRKDNIMRFILRKFILKLKDNIIDYRRNYSINNRRFLAIWFSIIIAFFSFQFIYNLDIDITIINVVCSFLLITYFPGSAVIRILRKEKIDFWINMVYSIGLSLFLQIILLISMNEVYVALGSNSPLVKNNVISWILFENLFLFILSFYFLSGRKDEIEVSKKKNISVVMTFSPLPIPLLGLTGALLNYEGFGNYIQLITIVGIVVLLIIPILNRNVGGNYLPWWIFCAGLSILFLGPLTSSHMFGSDMAAEYGAMVHVAQQQVWSSSDIHNLLNPILSVSILPLGYLFSMDISPELLFKTVIPFLMGFLPLNLFLIFRTFFGEKIAYYSVGFFISFSSFFMISFSDARIGFSELFLTLLLIVFFCDKKLNHFSRALLSFLFATAIVVSYYAIAFLLILAMAITFIYLYNYKDNIKKSISKPNFILFTIVVFFTWYIFTMEGYIFSSIVSIGQDIYQNLFKSISNTASRDPIMQTMLGLISAPTYLYSIMIWIFRITQVMIIIGSIIILTKKPNYEKNILEYKGLILANIIFLIVSIVQPYFVKTGITRMYQMTLIILSPAFIIGGIWLIDKIGKYFLNFLPSIQRNAINIVVIVILIPYLLFSSGFIAAVTNDHPISYAISAEEMRNNDDQLTKIRGNSFLIRTTEIEAAKWLADYRDTGYKVLSDEITTGTVLGPYANLKFGRDTYAVTYDYQLVGYLFLRYISTNENIYLQRSITSSFLDWQLVNLNDVEDYLLDSAQIFSNGDSNIMFRPFYPE